MVFVELIVGILFDTFPLDIYVAKTHETTPVVMACSDFQQFRILLSMLLVDSVKAIKLNHASNTLIKTWNVHPFAIGILLDAFDNLFTPSVSVSTITR